MANKTFLPGARGEMVPRGCSGLEHFFWILWRLIFCRLQICCLSWRQSHHPNSANSEIRHVWFKKRRKIFLGKVSISNKRFVQMMVRAEKIAVLWSKMRMKEEERSEINEKIKENMHVNSSRLHIYVHKKKTDPTQQTFFQHGTYICTLASDQMRKSSILHSWKAHLALASIMFVCFVSLCVSSFFFGALLWVSEWPIRLMIVSEQQAFVLLRCPTNHFNCCWTVVMISCRFEHGEEVVEGVKAVLRWSRTLKCVRNVIKNDEMIVKTQVSQQKNDFLQCKFWQFSKEMRFACLS